MASPSSSVNSVVSPTPLISSSDLPVRGVFGQGISASTGTSIGSDYSGLFFNRRTIASLGLPLVADHLDNNQLAQIKSVLDNILRNSDVQAVLAKSASIRSLYANAMAAYSQLQSSQDDLNTTTTAYTTAISANPTDNSTVTTDTTAADINLIIANNLSTIADNQTSIAAEQAQQSPNAATISSLQQQNTSLQNDNLALAAMLTAAGDHDTALTTYLSVRATISLFVLAISQNISSMKADKKADASNIEEDAAILELLRDYASKSGDVVLQLALSNIDTSRALDEDSNERRITKAREEFEKRIKEGGSFTVGRLDANSGASNVEALLAATYDLLTNQKTALATEIAKGADGDPVKIAQLTASIAALNADRSTLQDLLLLSVVGGASLSPGLLDAFAKADTQIQSGTAGTIKETTASAIAALDPNLLNLGSFYAALEKTPSAQSRIIETKLKALDEATQRQIALALIDFVKQVGATSDVLGELSSLTGSAESDQKARVIVTL